MCIHLADFYNPEIDVAYVSDTVLWSRLFQNPFPKDITRPQKGVVTLSNYFSVQIHFVDTHRGYKVERKRLIVKKSFFEIDMYERNTVFTVLCDFLTRFKRPYRECLILVPNHEEVNPREDFWPILLYFKHPQYPNIDRQFNTIDFFLSKDTLAKLTSYTLGCDLSEDIENNILGYSFQYFYGFTLQY